MTNVLSALIQPHAVAISKLLKKGNKTQNLLTLRTAAIRKMSSSIGGKRSQLGGRGGGGGGPDEPAAMFLQRPSSASKQDVGHVLARAFRDRFTRDTIPPATIELLKTSREGTDDAYHQHYVDSLLKVG